MDYKDKYECYNYYKQLLEENNIATSDYKDINYGLQFEITVNGQAQMIRIYESKKKGVRPDFSLVKNNETLDMIMNLTSNSQNADHLTSYNEKCEVDLPKSFDINDTKVLENIKKYLNNAGAKNEKPDLSHKDEIYIIYNTKITIFTSGKVLIQGKPSKDVDSLYNDILLIIKKEHQNEFKENIQEYFEDLQDYSDFFEEAEENNICDKGEEFLGNDLFHYLNINDQITILDAIELYEYAKDKKIKFKNYAIIVRNFAIAYEGFLIKIFIDSNILSDEEYRNDVRTALGSKLSKKLILEFLKDGKRNEDVAIKLEYVWKSHRNKNLHSDFLAPRLIDTFREAERDISEVKEAMQECFELLDLDRMNINKFSNSIDNDSFEIENVNTEDVLSTLVENGFVIKKQKKAHWLAQKGNIVIININNSTLKVIAPKHELKKYISFFNEFINVNDTRKADIEGNAIIGTDESGKGDYFGPLVIAGVYADEYMKKELKKLGVDDSKKLKDSHIALLASKIKAVCKYQIVSIGNQKYNELYAKIGNLNKLLAWGHARVIENILNETDCEIALSDQFGNPELIESALMSKGKKIHLEQRPKAEQNIVVAAASILARNEFVERLRRLSDKHNLEFPKGASDKTIEVGKEFVRKHGREKLTAVAKLHFKTTSKI